MQNPTDPVSVNEAIVCYGKLLEYQQRYLRVPGVQAAVFAWQDVVYTAAFGYADIEAGIGLTDAHLFRIASQTKLLTAIAVLQLAEHRRLELDDTVATHLPAIAGTSLALVTVRELLSQTAGVIRDGPDTDFWQLWDAFPDDEQLIAIAQGPNARVVSPGERWKYSNVAYGLLRLIIESASGRTYAEWIQHSILDRLALVDIGTELDPARQAEFATGYSSLAYSSRRVPIDHIETGALAAATGGYANAHYLVRMVAELLPGFGRLLGEESKRQMREPRWDTGTKGHRYGLGVTLVNVNGRELFGHYGAFPGHRTVSLVDADYGMVVSVMTNAIDAPVAALATALPRLVDLAGSRERPRVQQDLHRFVGRFANLWGVWDITVLGGRLYFIDPTMADPAASAIPLDVIDDTTLRFAGGSGFFAFGEHMRYRFTAAGAVEAIHGGAGGTLVPLAEYALPERVAVRRQPNPH